MRDRHYHAALNTLRKGHFFWLIQQAYKAAMIPLSQRLKTPICGPIEGIIAPTYRCNSDCLMCDIKRRGDRKNELQLSEWFEVIDDMVRLGVSGIGISGGEPLLSNVTIPLVRYITQKKLPVHISSNGFLLNEKKVEALLDAGLGSIAVSIDSSNPRINDQLRGVQGAFDKAVQGIKTVARVRKKSRKNLRLTVASVLSRKSLDTILDIIKIAKASGADTVSFLPVMSSGIVVDKDARSNALCFSAEDILFGNAVIDKMVEIKKKENFIDNSESYLQAMRMALKHKPFPATCFVGYTTCVIGADGNVFPCFDFLEQNRSIGNVKEKRINDIWKSAEYARIREVTARCRNCYLTCHQEFNLLYRFTGNFFGINQNGRRDTVI